MLFITTTTWMTLATVGAAVFAAIAAGASWAAVRQTRKIWREGRLPLLYANITITAPTGQLTAHVRNGGGGVARGAWVFALEGSEALLTGLPPEGMLAPGASVRLLMPWHRTSNIGAESQMVTWCSDAGGTLHAWAGGGAYNKWSNRHVKRHPVTSEEIVRHFFPEMPAIGLLTRVNYTTFEEA